MAMLFPADHPIWSHLAEGHTVLTVNRRLARVLAQDYGDYCRSRQLSVWQTPAIHPVESWFESALSRLEEERVLLTSAQCAALWEQVVEADLNLNGVDLLQVPATVRQVMRADALCCDYLISDYACDGIEQEAFQRWQKNYLRRCHDSGWLDAARVPLVIDQAVAEGRLPVETAQLWVGFDELPPVLQRVQRTLEDAGCAVQCVEAHQLTPQRSDAFCAADEISELRVAAQWARQQLEEQVGTVAVVVPDLQRLQGDVERIFYAELSRSAHPDRVPAETFNISLGHSLADQGMITAALTVLQLQEPLEFDQLSYLLRCPWFQGGVTQWQERVLFERRLREDNVLHLSCSDLRYRLEHSRNKPQGMVQLVEQLQLWLNFNDAVAPSVWVERINRFLQQSGWPGETTLDSRGYQVFAAWQEKILNALARLGVVKKTFSRSQLVSWLSRLCREEVFQPKAQDQRLQIVGVLETAALTFDALWLCGANERTFPGGIAFNPFLPVALQKRCQMPHSDLGQEARYARLLLDRLQCSAAQVVISYAQTVDDRPCHCSPYLDQLSWQPHEGASLPDTKTLLLETIDDHSGPALTSAQLQEPISGGTGLLKEQVQCPFKAFIHYRMRVRSLDVSQPGLTSRRRGDLLHRVLQLVWNQIGTLDRLLAYDDSALRQLISEQIVVVMDATRFASHERAVLGVEKQRLQTLIVEWLAVERQRSPFTVQSAEQRKLLQVGPLRINAIPDRIDVDGQGRMIVLDYKTGQVTASDLYGEVLLEPQLPLYALHGVEGDVAAVSFAQVRHGACVFKGVAVEDQMLPKVSGVEKCRAIKEGVTSWDELVDYWRYQIETAAADVAAGAAAVVPVHNKVCQFCDLKGVCRIDLQRVDVPDEGSDI